MCPHIPEAARQHPANVGRVVRCAVCWLVAYPDWQPRRSARFFGSIRELKQYAATLATLPANNTSRGVST